MGERDAGHRLAKRWGRKLKGSVTAVRKVLVSERVAEVVSGWEAKLIIEDGPVWRTVVTGSRGVAQWGPPLWKGEDLGGVRSL